MKLLKVLSIRQLDELGKVIYEEKDIDNLFHQQGQQFLVNLAFNTSSSIVVPTNYYIGLDNRTTLTVTDTLSNVTSTNEPNSSGYSRQSVNSTNGFSVALDVSSNYRATSGIITFSASGGSWGPVNNIFIATTSNGTGYLLSSAVLGSPRTVANGQSLTAKIAVSLIN